MWLHIIAGSDSSCGPGKAGHSGRLRDGKQGLNMAPLVSKTN